MISNKTEDAIQPPERALSREKLFETEKSDRYHVEVAYNTEEAIRLLEVGFECVTGEYHDGGKIFRKRK